MKKPFLKLCSVLVLSAAALSACQTTGVVGQNVQFETVKTLAGTWEMNAERSRIVRSLLKTGESTYQFNQVDIPHAGSAVVNSEGTVTFSDTETTVQVTVGPTLGSYKARYELGNETLKETVSESTMESIPIGTVFTYKRI